MLPGLISVNLSFINLPCTCALELLLGQSRNETISKNLLAKTEIGKVCYGTGRPIRPALICGYCSMKQLGVFYSLLDGMLVHRRVIPSVFAGTHLYTWVERGTARVKCLAQAHTTMSPARTRTTRSGVEHSKHEATAPPKLLFQTNPCG